MESTSMSEITNVLKTNPLPKLESLVIHWEDTSDDDDPLPNVNEIFTILVQNFQGLNSVEIRGPIFSRKHYREFQSAFAHNGRILILIPYVNTDYISNLKMGEAICQAPWAKLESLNLILNTHDLAQFCTRLWHHLKSLGLTFVGKDCSQNFPTLLSCLSGSNLEKINFEYCEEDDPAFFDCSTAYFPSLTELKFYGIVESYETVLKGDVLSSIASAKLPKLESILMKYLCIARTKSSIGVGQPFPSISKMI